MESVNKNQAYLKGTETPVTSSEEGKASSQLWGKTLRQKKVLKIYIKDAISLQASSSSIRSINSVRVNNIGIGDKIYSSIPDDPPPEHIASLLKEDITINFTHTDKDGIEYQHQPPLGWEDRFKKWISKGSSKCLETKDKPSDHCRDGSTFFEKYGTSFKDPTCHQFQHYLYCGGPYFSYEKDIHCINGTKVDKICSIKPFSYCAIMDAKNGESIHSMTYIGSGFCISKLGGRGCDIAVQSVEDALDTWSFKNTSDEREVMLITADLLP